MFSYFLYYIHTFRYIFNFKQNNIMLFHSFELTLLKTKTNSFELALSKTETNSFELTLSKTEMNSFELTLSKTEMNNFELTWSMVNWLRRVLDLSNLAITKGN